MLICVLIEPPLASLTASRLLVLWAQVGLEERRWFNVQLDRLGGNRWSFLSHQQLSDPTPVSLHYNQAGHKRKQKTKKKTKKQRSPKVVFFSWLLHRFAVRISLPFYDFLQCMQNPWQTLSFRRMFIYWEREVVLFTLFDKLVQRVEDLKRFGNSCIGKKGSRSTSKNWIPEEGGLVENHHFIIGDASFPFVNGLCHF